jgi:hypothetical protein
MGSALIVPALALAGLGVALTWPLGLIFTAFAFVGLSIGFVSTAGLTLLQASSAESEMGRTNSAHQFIRTLGITYGVSAGGAILLFVVGRRVGDIDAVRDVLAGDDIALGPRTADAIGAGLAWTIAACAGVGVVCFAAALRTAIRWGQAPNDER